MAKILAVSLMFVLLLLESLVQRENTQGENAQRGNAQRANAQEISEENANRSKNPLQMAVSVVVADTIRTVYDVEKRIALLRLLTGEKLNEPISLDLFRSVQEQIVNELLRNLAAKDAGIKTKADQIETGLENIAKDFGVERKNLESYIQNFDLELRDILELLESELLWLLYREQVLAPVIVVSEEEAREEKKRLEGEGERLKLRRIGVSYQPQDETKAAQALWTMGQIRERLLEGRPFAVLAKNFSEDSYREEGGEMGWVKIEDLSEEEREELANVAVGGFSRIIVEEDELVLFGVEDRQVGAGVSLDTVRNRLFLNRLGIRAKKRMMVLRDETYVDIRP